MSDRHRDTGEVWQPDAGRGSPAASYQED